MNLREFFQKNKFGVIVFALAVFVRLALFAVNLDANHGNFIETIRGQDGYYEISLNLVNGNGFSFDSGPVFTPEPLRPPVWIFVMALIAKVFGSYIPVFIFEIIIGSLIPVIGMHLAARIIPMRHSRFVGLLLAVEPVSALVSILTISEIPFTFLFLISLTFLFRYLEKETTRNVVWSAVFLGLAILVKPTIQFLPVIIPVALFFIYRKNLSFTLYKHCAYFILVSVLILVPWFFRNQREFGAIGLSAQPAYNLYTVLVPTVLSIESGSNYEKEHQAVQSSIDNFRGGEIITLSNSDYYITEALSILSQHKLSLLKSLGISMLTFFTHDGMLTVLGQAGVTMPNILSKPALLMLFSSPAELARDVFFYSASPGIFILLGRVAWILVTLLFIGGVWFYWRREKFSPFALIAIVLVVYFMLMTTANGFGMNARFRIPVNTFIFAFAIYGFSVMWKADIMKMFFNHEKTLNNHTDL